MIEEQPDYHQCDLVMTAQTMIDDNILGELECQIVLTNDLFDCCATAAIGMPLTDLSTDTYESGMKGPQQQHSASTLRPAEVWTHATPVGNSTSSLCSFGES